MLSSNVTGATLGLIGFGRIGQAMARKAHHGFDMNIMYFNPSDVDEYVIQDLNAKRCNTLEELLSQADFVSLHCPAGAGLDVYENEPAIHDGFLALENVTLLPHLGSATLETRTAMGEKVLANLAAYFSGEALPDQVC